MTPLSETQSEGDFRKIQVTGRASYIVSVPKRWVLALGLKPGDPIAVRALEDSSLLLIPKKLVEKTPKKEVRIIVSPADDTQSIIRRIISLYAVGCNTIYVKCKEEHLTTEQLSSIKDAIRRKLIGTEVVTESSNELILQILLGYPRLSVQDAIRRMFIIASSMFRDAVSALKNLDKDLARNVIETDDEVNRFDLYTVRLLKVALQDTRLIKEVGLKTITESLGYRLVTKSLERVADHAVRIAENVLAINEPIPDSLYQKILEYSSIGNKLLEDSLTALFKEDYYAADRVSSELEEIVAMEEGLLEMILSRKLDAKTISHLRLILESSKRISEYSEDIAEVTLNRTVEKLK